MPQCQTHPRLLTNLLPPVSAGRASCAHLEVHGVSVSKMQDVRCSTRDSSDVQPRGSRWFLVLSISSLSTLLRVPRHSAARVSHGQQEEVQRLDLRRLQALAEGRADITDHIRRWPKCGDTRSRSSKLILCTGSQQVQAARVAPLQ